MRVAADVREPEGGEVRRVTLPTGEIEIKVNSFDPPLDTLMGFAARANSKRGFLFVSKVLGKHWPVTPKRMAEMHTSLVAQIPTEFSGPVVFIALAETAIGLGQGIFEAYLKANPDRQGLFLHTSRYRVGESPIIEFEEAHSHAPRQFLHMPQGAALRDKLLSATTLVLIDDEASTGNTFFNLTKACLVLNPGIAKVHLATITNFMGPEATARLSERFGLKVSIGAALSGEYRFWPGQAHLPADSAQIVDESADRGASVHFGRLGIDKRLTVPLELAERLVPQIQTGEKVLVLGTGEFMHPAFLLASDLETCGIDVVVQSTTRSPILQWGAVGDAMTFPDNYGEGIANFLYNVTPAQYDHVIICHETVPGPALCELAERLDARLFHFHSENKVEEISIR